MRIFRSNSESIDEMVKFGFELALKYARLAKQYDKDIIKMLEEKLKGWED